MVTLAGPRAVRWRFDWRQLLLAGGVASLLIYVGLDALAAVRYAGYSYIDQTISELSAIDAPTRSLWISVGVLYNVVMVAFGFGVWESAGPQRALRYIGALAATVGLLGFLAWPFAPMHQREVLAAGGGTTGDTLHIILAGVSSAIFVGSVALGARLFDRRFARYSFATIAVVLLAGAVTAFYGPRIGEDDPTPGLGIAERIAVFGSMLWFAVLGITLLRRQSRPTQVTGGRS